MPVGCGAELRLWELQEAEGVPQPSPGLLGAPWALRAAGDAAADQLPEGPFLEIPGDLGHCSAKK